MKFTRDSRCRYRRTKAFASRYPLGTGFRSVESPAPHWAARRRSRDFGLGYALIRGRTARCPPSSHAASAEAVAADRGRPFAAESRPPPTRPGPHRRRRRVHPEPQRLGERQCTPGPRRSGSPVEIGPEGLRDTGADFRRATPPLLRPRWSGASASGPLPPPLRIPPRRCRDRPHPGPLPRPAASRPGRGGRPVPLHRRQERTWNHASAAAPPIGHDPYWATAKRDRRGRAAGDAVAPTAGTRRFAGGRRAGATPEAPRAFPPPAVPAAAETGAPGPAPHPAPHPAPYPARCSARYPGPRPATRRRPARTARRCPATRAADGLLRLS